MTYITPQQASPPPPCVLPVRCAALSPTPPPLTQLLPLTLKTESTSLRNNLPYVCMLVALDAYHDTSFGGIGGVAEQG